MNEKDLYPSMGKWLDRYLREKYRNRKGVTSINVLDTSNIILDSALDSLGILQQYSHIIGIDIKIDVLGVVQYGPYESKLFFIEAKKGRLNLQNVGQLLIYCLLCNPEEAFLFSSGSLGTLKDVFCTNSRKDILLYDRGARNRRIKIAQWDTANECPDSFKEI